MSVWGPVILRAITLGVVGLLLGAAFGHPWIGLSFVLSCYGLWHLYNLYVLHRWLLSSRNMELPDGFGIWEEIYDGLVRIQRRDRDKKRKLGKIVRQFQKSSSAMPDGVVVFDSYGQISWFNPAAAKYLHLSTQQDIGQRITNLIRSPRFRTMLEQRDFSTPVEITAPHPPHYQLSLNIVPYDENQNLLMVRDVSHVHKLERMRSEFIANASHELRTPLTVIRGYMESLADDTQALPNYWQRAVAAIDQQSSHMQRMVDDLMLSLRMESGGNEAHHSHLQMADIIRQTCEELQRLCSDDGIRIELQLDEGLTVLGDRAELQSVVRNLVSNAINYMPAEQENGLVTVAWQRNENVFELSVTDNGAGIARNHLAKITDRFYRINNLPGRYQQGTGLGLSIVVQVLQRHSAHLDIHSEVGKGSTFRCCFRPASEVEVAA